MKRGIILFLSLLIVVLGFNIISADIGMHPTMNLEIKQDGENIYGVNSDIIVCYNLSVDKPLGLFTSSYIRGGEPLSEDEENYKYVEELKENKKYTECSYCQGSNKKCWSTFQILSYVPEKMRIAVVYPVPYFWNNITTEPKVYESDYFNVKQGMRTYRYSYQAELNSDGTITIKNKTNWFTTEQFVYFILALILTILIELWFTKMYFEKKEKPDKINRKIILVNLISLPIFWFLMPLVLKSSTVLLIVGEVFVTLLEAGLIYGFTNKELSIKSSMILSVINNVCSLVLGGAIFLAITTFLMI